MTGSSALSSFARDSRAGIRVDAGKDRYAVGDLRIAHLGAIAAYLLFVARRRPKCRSPAPSSTELRQLLDTLIACITRTPVRGGALIEEPEHPYFDLKLNLRLEQLSDAAVR